MSQRVELATAAQAARCHGGQRKHASGALEMLQVTAVDIGLDGAMFPPPAVSQNSQVYSVSSPADENSGTAHIQTLPWPAYAPVCYSWLSPSAVAAGPPPPPLLARHRFQLPLLPTQLLASCRVIRWWQLLRTAS